MAPAEAATVRVEVAYAPRPREVDLVALQLPVGSTVGQAIEASGLAARHALPMDGSVAIAVWGRVVAGTTPLRDRDRVELLRPLLVDPKEARRQRYRSQGERRAARRR